MKQKNELANIFSQNLKFYLKQANKTQNDLTQDLGFSAGIVSEWMSVKKYPRIDNLEVLAHYFSIPKAFLIEDTLKPFYESIKDLTDDNIGTFVFSQLNVDFALRANISYRDGFIDYKDVLLCRKQKKYSANTLLVYTENDTVIIDNCIGSNKQEILLTDHEPIHRNQVLASIVEIRKLM